MVTGTCFKDDASIDRMNADAEFPMLDLDPLRDW
jgi:hypothetical protein